MPDQLVDPRNFTMDEGDGLLLPNAVAMSRNLDREARQKMSQVYAQRAIEKMLRFHADYHFGRMAQLMARLPRAGRGQLLGDIPCPLW